MKLVFVFVFVFVFFSSLSFASSETFPTKAILVQVFNFSIFVTVLFFAFHKTVKIFFHKRQKDFFAFEKQAQTVEREKQKELNLWKKKLQALKDQEKDIQVKAKKRGEELIYQKKEELKVLKNQLKTEADFLLVLDRAKRKKELLQNWKKTVITLTKNSLKKASLSSAFHQRRWETFLKQMDSYSKKRSKI